MRRHLILRTISKLGRRGSSPPGRSSGPAAAAWAWGYQGRQRCHPQGAARPSAEDLAASLPRVLAPDDPVCRPHSRVGTESRGGRCSPSQRARSEPGAARGVPVLTRHDRKLSAQWPAPMEPAEPTAGAGTSRSRTSVPGGLVSTAISGGGTPPAGPASGGRGCHPGSEHHFGTARGGSQTRPCQGLAGALPKGTPPRPAPGAVIWRA